MCIWQPLHCGFNQHLIKATKDKDDRVIHKSQTIEMSTRGVIKNSAEMNTYKTNTQHIITHGRDVKLIQKQAHILIKQLKANTSAILNGANTLIDFIGRHAHAHM